MEQILSNIFNYSYINPLEIIKMASKWNINLEKMKLKSNFFHSYLQSMNSKYFKISKIEILYPYEIEDLIVKNNDIKVVRSHFYNDNITKAFPNLEHFIYHNKNNRYRKLDINYEPEFKNKTKIKELTIFEDSYQHEIESLIKMSPNLKKINVITKYYERYSLDIFRINSNIEEFNFNNFCIKYDTLNKLIRKKKSVKKIILDRLIHKKNSIVDLTKFKNLEHFEMKHIIKNVKINNKEDYNGGEIADDVLYIVKNKKCKVVIENNIPEDIASINNKIEQNEGNNNNQNNDNNMFNYEVEKNEDNNVIIPANIKCKRWIHF